MFPIEETISVKKFHSCNKIKFSLNGLSQLNKFENIKFSLSGFSKLIKLEIRPAIPWKNVTGFNKVKILVKKLVTLPKKPVLSSSTDVSFVVLGTVLPS